MSYIKNLIAAIYSLFSPKKKDTENKKEAGKKKLDLNYEVYDSGYAEKEKKKWEKYYKYPIEIAIWMSFFLAIAVVVYGMATGVIDWVFKKKFYNILSIL